MPPKSRRAFVRHVVASVSKRSHWKDKERLFETVGKDDPRIPGVLRSGVPGIDAVIGIGGYPVGRVTMLAGPGSTGKTTLLCLAIAECQRRDGVAVFVDVEQKLPLDYAEMLGVDPEQMILLYPDTIEDGFRAMDDCCDLLRAKSDDFPVLFCWDSLHAGESKRSYDAGYGGAAYGPEAYAYGNCIRRFARKLRREKALLLWVSQARINPAVIYGDNSKLGVGNASVHFSSVVLNLKSKRKPGKVGVEEHQIITVTAAKNQVADPWKQCEFRLVYGGVGVDVAASFADTAVSLGVAKHRKKDGVLVFSLLSGERMEVAEGQPLSDLLKSDAPERAAIEAAVVSAMKATPLEPSGRQGEDDDDDDDDAAGVREDRDGAEPG